VTGISNFIINFGQTWLVGDGLKGEDQKKATEGTLFIPFSQFPPKKLRKDCFYHSTPAMAAPASLENVDSCEVIN
jgi:aldehyde decarbonylase